MKFSLEFLYYLTRSSGSSICNHQHSCFELVYYISGKGSTTINGTDYQYLPNTFTIIPPGTEHDEIRVEETNVLFIGFQMNPCTINIHSGIYANPTPNNILSILQKIKKEMLDKKPYFEIKLESLLAELIVDIARMNSEESVKYSVFSYIENFINENYSCDIDYHVLSKVSGYSYHRFRHIFKEVYGHSPHQYTQNLRLKNACRLLIEKSAPVSYIAQETGFATESYFCSIFKRKFGCTPGEYRNK